MPIKRQDPGQPWTYVSKQTGETDSGILPSKLGESSNFAIWKPNNGRNGGNWTSRKFSERCKRKIYRGEGRSGLLGRMRYQFGWNVDSSRRLGYKPPDTTPEQMLSEWLEQNGKCAACGGVLKDIFSSRYDHNHETGETRGYIHHHCNSAEGHIALMSSIEFESFVEFIRRIKRV